MGWARECANIVWTRSRQKAPPFHFLRLLEKVGHVYVDNLVSNPSLTWHDRLGSWVIRPITETQRQPKLGNQLASWFPILVVARCVSGRPRIIRIFSLLPLIVTSSSFLLPPASSVLASPKQAPSHPPQANPPSKPEAIEEKPAEAAAAEKVPAEVTTAENSCSSSSPEN